MSFLKSKKFLIILLIIGSVSLGIGLYLGFRGNNTKRIDNTKVIENKLNVNDKKASELNINSGLLIGLGKDDSTYRTLWISPENDQLKLKSQGDFILVPYGTDFWKIESKNASYDGKWETEYNSYDESQKIDIRRISAHPANQSFKWGNFNKKDFVDYRVYEDTNKLLFVGNKYVCLERYTYEDGGGTLRPWSRNIIVLEINKLPQSPSLDARGTLIGEEIDEIDNQVNINRVSIKTILGKNIETTINKLFSEPVTEKEQGRMGSPYEEISNSTNEFNWGISRQNSKWVPVIAKQWNYSNASTGWTDYNLKNIPGFTLPKSVTTYDELNPSFENIKKVIPNAIDAVSSPTKDMLAVMTNDKLLVYTNPKKGLTKATLEIKLNGKESLIMAQWATDDNVGKWDNEVEKYLK